MLSFLIAVNLNIIEPRHEKTNNVVSEQVHRSLKGEEELYFLSSANKGADQLRSCCEPNLWLCLRIALFSHMQYVGFRMKRLIL